MTVKRRPSKTRRDRGSATHFRRCRLADLLLPLQVQVMNVTEPFASSFVEVQGVVQPDGSLECEIATDFGNDFGVLLALSTVIRVFSHQCMLQT